MTAARVPPPPVLAAWSLYLPGVPVTRSLHALATVACGQSQVDGALGGPVPVPGDDARPPEQAALLLGRKGLLAKEPATRMALCAVHTALGLAPGQRPDGTLHPGTAVVACSNLGNLGTVVDVTRTLAAQGRRAVSPMTAPNASSNVVASSVALWFGFAGPNLMVCSGATAGLDSLALAALLLDAGRADRVVLVGAEPDDPVAAQVYAGGAPATVPAPRYPLRAGAACVVLARGTAGATAPVLAARPRPVPDPGGGASGTGYRLGPGGLDLAAHWGDCYGAQGVVQLAVAAHLAATGGVPVTIVGGDGRDGWREARVEPGTAAGTGVAPVGAAANAGAVP